MFRWFKRMFGSIKSADKKTPPQMRPDGFQLASISDCQFIIQSALSEAACGHFNSKYLVPIFTLGLKKQIRASIKLHRSLTHRGTVSESLIYVFIENARPIAFSWVMETENGGEKELYLLAVVPNHRKRGIGKIMVSESMAQFPPKTIFIARLYPASQTMLHMLLALGFKRIARQGNSSTTKLSYVS